MSMKSNETLRRSLPPYLDIRSLIKQLNQVPQAYQYVAASHFLREMYRNSLYLTAKYLLGYREVNERTHGKMLNALSSKTPRKLIVMPRGTFKTSVSGIAFPIWLLMSNPNLRILIDSELQTNSKNTLREIKTHLQTEALSTFFGNWVGPKWDESEIIIAQRTRIYKEPSIVCGGIGTQKTSQHYDVIIADDLNSPKNSNTREGCQKVIDHYRYYTSLLEPGGTLVVSGTRYSAMDVIGYIHENEVEAEGLISE